MNFFCDNCGKEANLRDEKCANCGADFTGIRCPSCGFSGKPGNFLNGCPKCGFLSEVPGPGISANKNSPEARSAKTLPGIFYKIAIPVLSLILLTFALIILLK